MTLQIDTALSEGFERTVARNGLTLVALFVGLGFVNAVVSQSLSVQFVDTLEQTLIQDVGLSPSEVQTQQGPTPYALSLSIPTLLVLTLLGWVVAEALRIVAIRVFVGDHTDRIPRDVATRRLGLATLHSLVAVVIVFVLTVFGLALLVVPGIYVALSFFFVRQEIAVADESVVSALGSSWSLTAGDRWELLGLAVIVTLITLVAGGPVIFLVPFEPAVSVAVSILVSGFTTVFGIAVATRAYAQLSEERDAKLGRNDAGASTDGEWSHGN